MFHRLSIAVLSLAMCACSTTSGPVASLGVDGPTRKGATTGLPSAFAASEIKSFGNQSDNSAAEEMLTKGFALIYGNCSEFFASAGDTQKWVIVARDAVGAIGTLATSVIAIHDGSKDAVANLALLTGISFSGLDIYTKNFLFASENVDSVRTLILNGLSTHQKAVLSLAPFTYQTTMQHLLDNQDICTPAAITALVRSAIKKGDVTPILTGQDGVQSMKQIGDQAVLQAIGGLLNPPGAITADQAGAFWWLLRDFSTAEERAKFIVPKLADLPTGAQPMDKNGAYQVDWKYADPVGLALDKLSAETKDSFRSALVAARAAATLPAENAAKAPAAPGSGPTPVAPTFTMAVLPSTTRGGRVAVGIR